GVCKACAPGAARAHRRAGRYCVCGAVSCQRRIEIRHRRGIEGRWRHFGDVSMRESRAALTVVRPAAGSGLGFFSWAREMGEAVRSAILPPRFPQDLPRGQGQTVLMIPGFLAGDWTMNRLREFLLGLDYRVVYAGVALNLGPTKRLIPQLEHAVEKVFADTGAPIIVIGQSLGGVFARGLAHRHPDKIAHVVTLCSPIHFPIATPLEGIANLLAPLHDPAVLDLQNEIVRTPPVPVTAIYSKSDGIVDWRSCL